MKVLNVIFWIATAGVGVSLAGGIAAAVRKHQETKVLEKEVGDIPAPAGVPQN